MEIRYTVTTSSCPHCRHVLKRESDLSFLWILLMIFSGFTALCWAIAIPILNSLFKYDRVKMGSPLINCPNCGGVVNTGEAIEWGLLKKEYKRNWAFRNNIRLCYALGGLTFLSILFQFLWPSSHEVDRTMALTFLIVAIISISVIILMYYKRKQSFNEDYITVNETDYDLIEESWTRLHRIEPLAYETETIKISGTEKIIKPQIPQTATKKNTTEIKKEQLETKEIINKEAKIETSKQVTENKAKSGIVKPEVKSETKPNPTEKKNQTKHIIVAKKNIKKD